MGVPRISEKLHEVMISEEEIARTFYNKEKNIFQMHYKNLAENPINTTFSSDQVVIDKEELNNYLKQKNYYKQ